MNILGLIFGIGGGGVEGIIYKYFWIRYNVVLYVLKKEKIW